MTDRERGTEIREKWEAIPRAIDPDAQDAIYRALWPSLQDDVPITLLYPLAGVFVAHRRVRGLRSPFRSDPVMHAEELWLDDSRDPR